MVFSVFAMQNIVFLKNTDPKNQVILFFCFANQPYFSAVLPIDQKINLVFPNSNLIPYS